MLLSTLKCTLQPSRTKSGLVQNVSGAEAEKLYSAVTITRLTTQSKRNIQNLISPISRPSHQLPLLLVVPHDVIDVEN